MLSIFFPPSSQVVRSHIVSVNKPSFAFLFVTSIGLGFTYRKMSIGKVDCTIEKKLCKRFGVKGYPTMKYHRDGDFHDYPLGRDKDSIM